MFGSYRFLLAMLVALSHFGLTKAGFHPGQWAVVGFYLLSGYLMQKQATKLGSWFLPDRLLRVLPLFWAALLALALGTGALRHPLENLTLLPLAYWKSASALHPLWSLAVEMHYYLLTPLLIRLDNGRLRLVAWASVAVFAVSPWLPYSTWWAYTGPLGTLFAYVVGMLVARRSSMPGLLPVIGALLVAYAAGKILQVDAPSGININVCIGTLAALPMVRWLATRKENALGSRLGTLTYPLFLLHELVHILTGWSSLPALIAGSLAASWLAAELIEKPADRLRHRLRLAYGRRVTEVAADQPAA
ncbi:MAG: acyltransferase [Aquabacterium sp.]|nr:MAG: acyltransferase [Aquabacterium sp.]